MSKIYLNGVSYLRIHMILGHDLLIPYEDSRVMKEAASLSDTGHDVTVLCWSKRIENASDRVDLDGFSVRRIFQDIPGRKSWIGSKLPVYLRLRRTMVDISARERPDIAYCHDLETLPIGKAISRKTGSKLVYDSHENWPLMESMNSRVWGTITGIIERRLLRHVDLVITVNDILREKFSYLDIPSVVVMNCAREDWASRRCDRDYPSGGVDMLRVAYWGGVAWRKGLKCLVEIAEILDKENRPISFEVFGTGPDLDTIRELISSKGLSQSVTLRGSLSHDALSQELSDFDLCYALHLPTEAYLQSIPVKLLEGLALGMPFIGNTEFPLVAQIVREFDCGLLSKYSASEAADTLSKLFDAPEILAKLRRNAREAFEKKYNWQSQAEKLVEAIEILRKKIS
ncbi:MAG TPA: glycosyltransferase [Euryarchaeota archaeon]|nr:glycosyltransferase [Euryarchaeota archaeon]